MKFVSERSSHYLGGLVLALFLVASFAAPARAGAAHAWVKDGATADTMEVDYAACTKASQHAPATAMSVPVYGNPLGAALGTGIVWGIQRGRAQNAFVDRCMRGHGYVTLWFTPEERTELGKQRSLADRLAWAKKFYASDLAARVEAARRPVVPPLPEAKEEGLTYGAVRFNPSALTAAVGPALPGQPLLMGRIWHRRTATLKAAVDLPLPLGSHADAGSVFQELIDPTDIDAAAPYWCGPIREKQIVVTITMKTCVSTDEKGYVVELANGEAWLATGPDESKAVKWRNASVDFSMVESEVDLLGPVDFEIDLKRLTDSAAYLEAKASKDGKFVTLWSGKILFGSDRAAVLPFWTHRLVLIRSGKSVTTVFSADGDGKGWSDAMPAS